MSSWKFRAWLHQWKNKFIFVIISDNGSDISESFLNMWTKETTVWISRWHTRKAVLWAELGKYSSGVPVRKFMLKSSQGIWETQPKFPEYIVQFSQFVGIGLVILFYRNMVWCAVMKSVKPGITSEYPVAIQVISVPVKTRKEINAS